MCSLLFHIAGTWTLPLIDRDEPRFAEASREMMQRGDYVVPYFNNQYRFDKPPLIYWLQVASYRILGDNDFAARLPSAIAAALTAVLLFLWGKRVGDERVGWWAAIMFTLCLQTFVHAKAAVADMVLVLFFTAAHWAGYELLRDWFKPAERPTPPDVSPASAAEPVRVSRMWWWVFYLSLALAFLAKGPIGWMPLLTLAALKFFLRDVRLNRRFLFVTGILLVLSIVAVWGIPAIARTQGDFFHVGIGKHVFGRSLVALEGHGGASIWNYVLTLPFYFVTVFLSFLPWSFKLPWLTRRLWKGRDPIDLYLFCGVAVVFLVFTLVKTKLPHYTLPAFPLLALLLAKNLRDVPHSGTLVRRTSIVAASVALLAVVATPFAARFAPSLQLMRASRHELTPEMEFGVIEYKDPSLVWYFRKHIGGWMSDLEEKRRTTPVAKPSPWKKALADATRPSQPARKKQSPTAAAIRMQKVQRSTTAFMNKPGGRFVIIPTEMVPLLYPELPSGWVTFNARGLNTATGKPLDLTLILKRS